MIPYKQGMGRVIADLYYPDGQPVSVSPRQVLRKVLEEFETDQYRVYGAFEYEFYVFRGILWISLHGKDDNAFQKLNRRK